jgi:hypothetical protein
LLLRDCVSLAARASFSAAPKMALCCIVRARRTSPRSLPHYAKLLASRLRSTSVCAAESASMCHSPTGTPSYEWWCYGCTWVAKAPSCPARAAQRAIAGFAYRWPCSGTQPWCNSCRVRALWSEAEREQDAVC